MYSDRKIKEQRCEVGCQINLKGFGSKMALAAPA